MAKKLNAAAMTANAGPTVKKSVKTEILPVRMGEHTLAHLAEVAERQGVGVSTLVRMWVLERLGKEPSLSSGPWVQGTAEQ